MPKQDIAVALHDLKTLNEELTKALSAGMGEWSHLMVVGKIVEKMARIVGIEC